MAQAGRLVICGDAGDGLGDSIYEAGCTCAVGGELGRDCVTQADASEHHAELARAAGPPPG